MNTNTQHIPFIRKLMKNESEQDITSAEERFIAFAPLVLGIGTRLLENGVNENWIFDFQIEYREDFTLLNVYEYILNRITVYPNPTGSKLFLSLIDLSIFYLK